MKKVKITMPVLALSLLIALFAVESSNVAQTQPAPSSQSAQPTRNASPANEEADLNRARRENEEAQARYYRKLTENLEEPPADKSFGARFVQSIADSPASVLGVFGALIAVSGALIAARTTFLSFLFNYYANLKSQSDNQFYEALKRFGDQGSPAIRASAAGMLATMASSSVVSFPEQPTFWSRTGFKRTVEQPYLKLATNQFLAALVLEQNETVLELIKSGLFELMAADKETVRELVYNLNLELQEKLIGAFAEYFAASGVNQWSAVDEIVLKRAEDLAHFGSTKKLRSFIEGDTSEWGGGMVGRIKPQRFAGVLERASKRIELYDESKKSDYAAVAAENLRLSAKRVQLNTYLLRAGLSDEEKEKFPGVLSLTHS